MDSSRFLVSAGTAVDFCPATVAAEVVQNVRTILATRVGTVPLDRAFGTEWDMVDRPLPVAQQLARAAFFDAVQSYEPRAVIEKIEFREDAEGAMDGSLVPELTITLADGVDGAAATVQED